MPCLSCRRNQIGDDLDCAFQRMKQASLMPCGKCCDKMTSKTVCLESGLASSAAVSAGAFVAFGSFWIGCGAGFAVAAGIQHLASVKLDSGLRGDWWCG